MDITREHDKGESKKFFMTILLQKSVLFGD